MLFALQSLELEVGEAKIIQAQKAQEASCILAKFEEAQDMMREADIISYLIINFIISLSLDFLCFLDVLICVFFLNYFSLFFFDS